MWAGSIACVLVWLKIEPKDILQWNVPHSLWLVGGILLYALGIVFPLRREQSARKALTSAEVDWTTKVEGLRKAIETLNTQVTEHKQRADENFGKWNKEVQEHQETKARERDANTFRMRTEAALAECKKTMESTRNPWIATLDTGAGFQVESAWFGAPDLPAIDVTAKVKEIVAAGESGIPVNWLLLLGYDPRPNVLKSLKTTFSIVRSEGKEVFIPEATPQPLATALHVPDITGNVPAIRLSAHGYLRVGNNRTIHCELNITCSLHNLGPEATDITKLTVTSLGNRGCRCLLNMLDKPIHLGTGDIQNLIVIARIEFEDDESNSIPFPLALIATDLYNGKHLLPIRVALPEIPSENASA